MIKEIGLKSGKVYTLGEGSGHDLIESIVQDRLPDNHISVGFAFYTINYADKSHIIILQEEVDYVRRFEASQETEEPIYKNEAAVYENSLFPEGVSE